MGLKGGSTTETKIKNTLSDALIFLVGYRIYTQFIRPYARFLPQVGYKKVEFQRDIYVTIITCKKEINKFGMT